MAVSKWHSMNYVITFPIPVYQENPFTFYLPTGLYRDVATQSKFTKVRMICLCARAHALEGDMTKVDLREFSNLSLRCLPYGGGRKGLVARLGTITSILKEEAQQSDVWHSCCSLSLFDITTLSYRIGRRYCAGAPGVWP